MAESNNDSVTIRVKSASHRCEDLEFPCDLSANIRQVKETITLLNALHPGISEQRLIYSGHLLDDHQIVRDIVLHNQTGDVPMSSFTFHLACSSRSYKPVTPLEPQTDAPIHEPTRPSPENNYNAPQTGVPQDLLALHQVYVEQMMAFMNHWSQGNMDMHYQFPDPSNANFTPVPDEFNNVRNEARDNVRVNEAVPAREDDENPRDVLDWMYTFSRLVLVFSVVYFYSNFTRFFLVVVFTGLVMIMQRRHAQVNNAEVEPRVQEAADPQPPAQQEQVAPQPRIGEDGVDGERPVDPEHEDSSKREEEVREAVGTGGGDPEADDAESREETVQEPPAQPRAPLRDITWTFLTTFFTSLIPEMPQNN